MNEITPGDVRKWQNEMVAFRNENGKSLFPDLQEDNAQHFKCDIQSCVQVL